MACSTNLTIHQGMGTTQEERFLAALKTDYFLIDERSETDYIEFAQKLSVYVRYFNENNAVQGDWSSFFQWESTSILVRLYLWDVEKLQHEFEGLKSTVEDKDQLFCYFKAIREQFDLFIQKIETLDDVITAKEFLWHSKYLIEDAFKQINEQIESASLADALLKSYIFNKTVQQLFGLFFNWKQVSGESVKRQLEEYPGHTPHYTLFLAFLKLLGVAKDELNGFTKKHLDFYYKDVLQLKPMAAQPDYVHLIAEPAVNAPTLLLPKNTVFPAGKNNLGQNKYYASTEDHSINTISLKYFLSAFVINEKGNFNRRQADLSGLNAKGAPFNVFPVPDSESPYIPYDTPTETGLLIASPLLYLSGGDRYIRVTIDGQNYDQSQYRFYITSEKGCIEIEKFSQVDNSTAAVSERLAYNNISYLYIPATEKKIIGYNPDIHKEIKASTSFPILKIVPKEQGIPISVADNSTIAISIRVRNFKNFILATDTGTVDTNKPFLPFGDFPKNGNGFVIGSNEFFIKKGAIVSIKTATTAIVSVFKLNGGKWESDPDNTISRIINSNPITEYNEENNIPDNNSVSGYIRIELNDNTKKYKGEQFLKSFINAAKADSDIPEAPVIRSIFLDYDVDDTTKGQNPIQIFEIFPFGFQIKNFISSPITKPILAVSDSLLSARFLEKKMTSAKLIKPNLVQNEQVLPQTGGEIYLGFENALAGNSISLLLQLAEGTVNPRKTAATINWQYLNNNNQWTAFKNYEVGDETNGLLESGLVHFSVPEDFKSSGITILPDNLFWIRIIVNTIDAISNFIGVHNHALKAVLTDLDKNGSLFSDYTSKDTITKLYQPVDYIRNIYQPYTSFGGKKEEDDTLLYRRSSERLRHKSRAITIWDYERLLLQQYPEVSRVKCLNHYRYEAEMSISNVSAGYVTLIPVAKSTDSKNDSSWKPLVSLATMKKMKEYIATLASPHTRIMVKPPSLEKIRLNFSVKYRDIVGADTRLYETNIKNAINYYLSPWAYGSSEVQFANAVETSSLIQLIDDLPFVDYITNFSVDQLLLDETDDDKYQSTLSNVKKIIPSTDFTLFVPNEVHNIQKI